MNRFDEKKLKDYMEVAKLHGCNVGETHLCFDCKNGYPSKCQKIADNLKRPISMYTFIKDGKQTFDEEGELESFKVYDCINFEYVSPKPVELTTEKRKRINSLRRKMLTLYFDADSIEEADQIQYEMYHKGLLDINENHLANTNKVFRDIKNESDKAYSKLENAKIYGSDEEIKVAAETYRVARARVRK